MPNAIVAKCPRPGDIPGGYIMRYGTERIERRTCPCGERLAVVFVIEEGVASPAAAELLLHAEPFDSKMKAAGE